jgi:hypothetical protein
MIKQEAPSRFSIAREIYRTLPIHNRAVTVLSQSIASELYRDLAEVIREGGHTNLTTQPTRDSIIRKIAGERSSASHMWDESSTISRVWNRGDDLSFNCLVYAITKDKENFLDDAHVAYVLSSLDLAHRGQTKKHANDSLSTTSYIYQLEPLAKDVLASSKWKGLVDVARKYFEIPLAGIMYEKSLLWDRAFYSLDDVEKKTVGSMIASSAMIIRPDEVVSATRQVCHEIYNLEL